jgi:hypothetical protein
MHLVAHPSEWLPHTLRQQQASPSDSPAPPSTNPAKGWGNQKCTQHTPLATCCKDPHRGHIIKIAHWHPPSLCPPRSRQRKHPLKQLLPLRCVPHRSGPSQPIQLGHCACSKNITNPEYKGRGTCLVSPAVVHTHTCSPVHARWE